MTTNEREQMQRWVSCWQSAGEALEQIKRQELEAFDYQQHWQMVDDLLRIACERQAERLTSGLIEQQFWFMQLRQQQQTVTREA